MLGFDLHGKTVGIIGTGNIGALFGRICIGFGCHVIAYDITPNPDALSYGIHYVSSPDELWRDADIISLHCPLLPTTHHVINHETIAKMKPGVMLINTSRGGLVDTKALIDGLKRGHIGSIALDVFEGNHRTSYLSIYLYATSYGALHD